MKLELLTHLDLSAASGLVHHAGRLFAVADDGLELLATDLSGANPSRLPLGEGPRVATIPKDRKPDFEALLVTGGTLLALGSGSSAARRLAIGVNPEHESRRHVDLRPLYAALDRRIHELNIEGAVVSGDEVLLAQRGNGARRENALIHLDRATFERELETGVFTEAALREIVPVALGALEGVALSLTDLCLGPGGTVLFTAAAENTDNPYDDGVVAGSVVGVLDRRGRVDDGRLVVAPGVKLEGLCWLEQGELRLVADPDDPSARAPLFRLAWPS
ncbi:MAG: hypothetical protein Q8L48_08660 [Archangium sp.]|nr:hypothetical protein [Archangium sp.]